jgi:hypothetical protein
VQRASPFKLSWLYTALHCSGLILPHHTVLLLGKETRLLELLERHRARATNQTRPIQYVPRQQTPAVRHRIESRQSSLCLREANFRNAYLLRSSSNVSDVIPLTFTSCGLPTSLPFHKLEIVPVFVNISSHCVGAVEPSSNTSRQSHATHRFRNVIHRSGACSMKETNVTFR